MPRTPNISSLIIPSSAPIPTPLAPRKRGRPGCPALGRSRGGFSTKVHITVDGLGNPLRSILTGGQENDIAQAEALLSGYAGEYVIADKGYDAKWLRECIAELGRRHRQRFGQQRFLPARIDCWIPGPGRRPVGSLALVPMRLLPGLIALCRALMSE